MDKKSAATNATKLLGRYPKGSAEDPDEYVRAIAGVLQDYPQHIVEHLINHLPEQNKWLPTVYETRQFADAHLEQLTAPARYAERVTAQLAERDRTEQPRNPTLMAKCQAWLNRSDPIAYKLSGVEKRAQIEARIATEARQALIAQIGHEAFNALPNAPAPSATSLRGIPHDE